MTECERIIREGILPRDFLKEEVRCDFLVDEKRKKIWAVGLDLLLKFDEICRRHNLKYFLGGGTLLGAVRHRGFIPWDDDLDVLMPRDDYEKLLRIGLEFKFPYFLQTPYTDSESCYSYAFLRNCNTTLIFPPYRYSDFNMGQPLDIFPLDRISDHDVKERFDKIKNLTRELGAYMRRKSPYLSEEDRKRVAGLSGRDPREIYEEVQRIATEYNRRETEYLGIISWTGYDWSKSLTRASWYSDTVYLEFEGFPFPAPAGYEEYLTTWYGDWHTFPPEEERGKWHETVYFDPDTPYLETLKRFRREDALRAGKQ